MHWRYALTIAVCSTALATHRLAAQCPDGAPPPCATRAAAPATNPHSVAVLYFDNLSRDTADTWLAAGLTEELIIRLSQVGRLEVKSRFESQRARGQQQDPRVLGRTMRAAWLVSGSLQQAGQRLRLRVSLVRAATGAQVWGEVYDRTGDAMTIQADVAREIAQAITGRLLPSERATLARRPSHDPLAYDLYVRALGALNSISETGLRAGFELLDRALARDSSFADAWSRKALAWTWLADGYVVGRTAYGAAREAAERALRLDSSQALAWAVLSNCAQALDLEIAGSVRLARRAVAVDPRLPVAHLMLALSLFLADDSTSSVSEAQRAFDADTLDTTLAYLLAYILYRGGNADALAAHLRRTAGALGPDDQRHLEGALRLLQGDAAGAAERLSWRYYGGAFAGEYVRALARTGRGDAAQAVVDSMVAFERTEYFNAYAVAAAYGSLGDVDRALPWLDRAFEQRTAWLAGLRRDRNFEAVLADPRIQSFMWRVGLALARGQAR